MKAVVYTEYGSPAVLRIVEVEKPSPKDNEVLIKVYATTASAVDSHYRRADPFITRFMNGLTKPNGKPGGTFAGMVEAVGKDVSLYSVGETVFGATTSGANAEYISLPENAVMMTIPAGVTYEDVAALPEALTPLYFLRDLAKVQPEQHVLVNGASGTVGTFAVQLARYFGAEVTGVCSNANVDLVKSLGADTVIDYTTNDFTQHHEAYDVIFDAVGKSSFSACKDALKEGGRYLTVAPSLAIMWQMPWTSRFGSKKAVIGFAGLNFHKEDLGVLKALVEAGKILSVNDRSYPLEQIAEAHRYVDTGHKKGNVIITVA